jgi:predicted nucleotidyltransferase
LAGEAEGEKRSRITMLGMSCLPQLCTPSELPPGGISMVYVETPAREKIMTTSRIEALMTERKGHRLALASARAVAALAALENARISAWVVGSLARRTFGYHSDVDFLVDCDQDEKHAAFRIVEAEMRDFPFHFISSADLDETTRNAMMEEAAGASSIRPYAHPAG